MPHRHAAVDQEWRAVRAADPADAAGPEHGRLTFLGHSTVLIEVDDLRILMDPVLRDGLGPVRRQVRSILPELFADLDAVFISHGHHDHLDLAVPAPDPGPAHGHRARAGSGASPGEADLGPVEEVEPGDRLTIDRVHFSVVHALHSGKREPFGPTGPAIGCVVEGSRTVYFPGDTDLFPGMSDLAGRLDLALLPVWGWGPDDRQGAHEPRAGRAGRGRPPAAARRADPLGDLLPGGPAARGPGPVRDARPGVRRGGGQAGAGRAGADRGAGRDDRPAGALTAPPSLAAAGPAVRRAVPLCGACVGHGNCGPR